MRTWLLRAAWITLPLTAGPAVSQGLRSWGGSREIVGAVLCWLAWALGLLATLAPRPAGLTVLRVVAPAGVATVTVVAVAGAATSLAIGSALAATLVTAALAADPVFAEASVNGSAYSAEHRYPLRVPPGLFLGPLLVARAVVALGAVAGLLLLAAHQFFLGAVALALGLPIATLAAGALHRLSRRWLVLVPAGVVVVDPMTLADNVLFPREHLRALRALGADESTGDVLDLRLGAALGSVLLVFDEGAELTRAPRPRRPRDTVRAGSLAVAIAHRDQMLAAAQHRGLPITATERE